MEAELASTRSSKTDSIVQIAELKRSVQVGFWLVMTWLAKPSAQSQWRLFKMWVSSGGGSGLQNVQHSRLLVANLAA